MFKSFTIGKPITLAQHAEQEERAEYLVDRQALDLKVVPLNATRGEHYCHTEGAWMPTPESGVCLACGYASAGASLVDRDAAADIAHATDPTSRTLHARVQWPGRRAEDTRPWIALIVVAFLAVAALAVPAEWKLDPAHAATQSCR